VIDRERKRQADRARRAQIKAGRWDFPNGGAADLAKAGAAIDTLDKPPGSPTNPIVSATAPRRAAIITAPASRVAPPAPAPYRAFVVTTAAPASAPQSMIANGGRPGRGLVAQGYGYAAPPDIAAVSNYTKWRNSTETMLAALAAKSDAQERRIAALETAAANRRADALAVAHAFVGLFRFAVRR
jgi:hypothetical protein